MTGIDENKLAGGKRKNGHSSDCKCHICENMMNKAKRNGYTKDARKQELRKKGIVKKNGHEHDCVCPICKNMKNKSQKQKGGDDSDDEKMGGEKKKKNGHKLNCKCPICKNMKNMKKMKKGGQDPPDLENQKGDIEEGGIKSTAASDADYDNLDNIPDANVSSDDANDNANADANAAELGEAGSGYKAGGTRRKKTAGCSQKKG